MYYEKACIRDSAPTLGTGRHVGWNAVSPALRFLFYSCSYEVALLSNGGDEAEHTEHASVTELAVRLSYSRTEIEGVAAAQRWWRPESVTLRCCGC